MTYRETTTAPQVEPLLVDARTAAAMLAIGQRTLWTLTQSQQVKSIRVGRRVLYSPDELRAFVQRRAEASTSGRHGRAGHRL